MKLELSTETGAHWRATVDLPGLRGIGPLLALIGAALLWFLSVHDLDVRQMNDLGLVSILPPTTYLAILIVTVSFCWSVAQTRAQTWLLFLHLLTLIVMLFGVTALLAEQPRFPVTWQHLGFTEFIARTGTLAKGLDARFSWPGFFVLNAFLTHILGEEAIRLFAGWAGLCFNLLYLGPLVLIMNTVTTDHRLAWLSVWLFYLTNWVGQDYFAPQAFNFFIYLVLLAILLRWFNGERPRPEASANQPPVTGFSQRTRHWGEQWWMQLPPNAVATQRQQSGLIAIYLVLFAVVVSSHQLTPFVALAAVGALVLLRRCRLHGLPLLMTVMIAAWLGFMTADFLDGHLRSILNEVGRVLKSVNANVTERVNGSPQHAVIIYLRLVMTSVIWALAGAGVMRRLWHGRFDLTTILLALAPFTVLALQSYGGEVLLRVYLFNLPFMAFAAAGLIYPTPNTGVSWRSSLLTMLLSLLLLSGLQFTRYGNERMDFVTDNDVDGLEYLYTIAPPGARFITISPYLPWAFQDVERYSYRPHRDDFALFDIPTILRLLHARDVPQVILILTRAQKAYGELFYGLPAGWGEKFTEDLLATGRIKLIFDNRDVQLFVLTESTVGQATAQGVTP